MHIKKIFKFFHKNSNFLNLFLNYSKFSQNKMSASNLSKTNINPNLCFTKYDKDRLKMIGKN